MGTRAFRHLVGLAGVLCLLAAPAARAQQDARWNALYDRIIRLEHDMKALRGLPGGAGPSERRLRALEEQIARLRREIGARLNAFDARLRRLESARATGRRAAPPGPSAAARRAPLPPVARSAPLAPAAPQPGRPRLRVEIEPQQPREELLGRMRVDDLGRPLPPRTTTSAPAPAPSPAPPAGEGLAPAPLPGVPLPGSAADGAAPAMPDRVQAAPLDAPSGMAPTAPAAPAANAESLLKRARDNFLARRFGIAEASYRAFLAQHPNHPKAPQAQFELGETHYVQGRYKEAGKAYLRTYQRWPRAAVSAQALLRLGMSLKRLGQKKQACKTWSLLRAKFPASRAARKSAPREMKRAGCR